METASPENQPCQGQSEPPKTPDAASVLVALMLLTGTWSVSDVFVGAHASLFVPVLLSPAALNGLSAAVALLLLSGFLQAFSVIFRRTGQVVVGVRSQPLIPVAGEPGARAPSTPGSQERDQRL